MDSSCSRSIQLAPDEPREQSRSSVLQRQWEVYLSSSSVSERGRRVSRDMESGGSFLISGGCLQGRTLRKSVEELQAQFPHFSRAVVAFLSRSAELSNDPGSTEDLLGCIAASFSEDEPRKKRFHVYREIALVLGYAERTALPLELELAVKLEFSEPGETFTGFKE
ncbi:hypothetical protein R1sor_008397 [Riccia sorocarpa]|uniref:Uncharacterized protein n=1 Tax=Riccia sorocarpa TaxID=122646 RepID=A0ABD3HVF2_9MARC